MSELQQTNQVRNEDNDGKIISFTCNTARTMDRSLSNRQYTKQHMIAPSLFRKSRIVKHTDKMH